MLSINATTKSNDSVFEVVNNKTTKTSTTVVAAAATATATMK
jgi:hypothetical protein